MTTRVASGLPGITRRLKTPGEPEEVALQAPDMGASINHVYDRGVRRICLQKGVYALVDAIDAERVRKFTWAAVSRGGRTMYARTHSSRLGKNWQLLHRFIMDVPPGVLIDHVNGNGLDNRRANLRIATPLENSRNSYVMSKEGKTSRFKGVSFAEGRWVAGIRVCGESIYLGSFKEEIDAARAYDRAACEKFGEFARTNEMMGLISGEMVDRHPSAKGVTGIWQPFERSPEEFKRYRKRFHLARKRAKERLKWYENLKTV